MSELGNMHFVSIAAFMTQSLDKWREFFNNMCTHIILVFDDYNNSEALKTIEEIFRTFRHNNISCIMISQNFKGNLMMSIRRNCPIRIG